MTAYIRGFVSRAEAGLRPPRSVSHNISPGSGGVTWHYGGPNQHIRTHRDCLARWLGWQRFHMRPGGLGATNGASDIAYNLGACIHGYAFAGRGAGVRSGANGTSLANSHYYAVAAIIGEGESPTPELFAAMEWATLQLRRSGAGWAIEPHSRWRATACPGTPIRDRARSRNGRKIVELEEEVDVAKLDDEDYDAIAEAVARKLGWYDPDRGRPRSYQADMSRVRDTVRATARVVGVPSSDIRA